MLKMIMKRIIRTICFIILFPLVSALMQASLVSASDCLHCQKQQVSKPDCCKVMNRGITGVDIAKGAESGGHCSHAGFCQGGVGPTAQLLPCTTQFKNVSPASFVIVVFTSSQPDSSLYDPSLLSPPKFPLQLFTLNCSFLI